MTRALTRPSLRLAVLRAGGARAALLAASALVPVLPLVAQEGGMEEFAEVDPYTEGEPETLERLGYVAVGTFLWHGGNLTDQVQATMGGLDFLWVETQHFKIGSSLGTYEIPNDRDEKEKLEDELAALKRKLGKRRMPRRSLDPWLRLHLYAQRAEEAYASFVRDFELEPAAFEQTGPHLGHPNKFLVLLCERQSEFGRYLAAYMSMANDYSLWTGWDDDCMFFGLNSEIIVRSYTNPQEEPFDTMVHCRLASGLAQCFIDGYKQRLFLAPPWFSTAVGHVYARRIDPRFAVAGGKPRASGSDHWQWGERVAGLAKNDFFATMETMFQWPRDHELHERDHMVVWSKVTYILEELDGDAAGWLSSMCLPARGYEAGTPEELEKRQTTALLAHYELTPEELDERWQRWLSRKHR